MLSKKLLMLAVVLSVCTPFFSYANIPSWVFAPQIKDGMATTDCVSFSGNMSVDAKLSAANARLALAQQVNTQINSVLQVEDARQSNNQTSFSASSFLNKSQFVTNQGLTGTQISQSQLVSIQGKTYFCSLAVLAPEQSKKLFDKLNQHKLVQALPNADKPSFADFIQLPAKQLALN